MKVNMRDSRTGLTKTMAPRFAAILSKTRRFAYMTRDLVAEAPAATSLTAEVAAVDATASTEAAPTKPAQPAADARPRRPYVRKPPKEGQ